MKIKTLGFIGLFIISFHINADQNIEIVGGSGMGLPSIAVVNFESDISSDNNMTDIIAVSYTHLTLPTNREV